MENFIKLTFANSKTELNGKPQVFLGNKSCTTFAEWNWDGEKLIVQNDRFGFYPIYYLEKPNEIIVSNSISKLLEFDESKELNDNAFGVFLRLGWLIGNDTLFASIKALPPASVLTWQNGKMEIVSQEIVYSKKLEISRNEAIKIYDELFQKAIEKTLPKDEKFAVPISGGRDSRHILFELHKQNLLPDACLTLVHPPPRPNEDLKIAKQICEELNLKHFQIEQNKTRFDAERRKNVLTGFSVNEHGWFLALADFVKDRWQTVYDGIAGDVLSAGLFLNEKRLSLFEQGKFEELADEIFEKEAFLPVILDQKTYQKYSRERAVNYLCKELTKHADAPNPIGSFFFWNRTRRCIAVSPFNLFGDSVNVVSPYLENELFDFLATLPANLLLDHRFHTDTISFAYPKLAHIPYEDKNSPLNYDFNAFKNYSLDILKFSLTARNKRLINRKFLLLRHLRSMLHKSQLQAVVDFGEQAVNLLQIERL
ncbi:MAG TPA: asparagine synthase-related protein [Pyrinomonadaceae bacterium]|nr:asparagine synthase-related protein [Pyrinomonadaceae bacterium]